MILLMISGNNYEHEDRRVPPLDEPQEPLHYHQNDDVLLPKKRRKRGNSNLDHQAPGTRLVSYQFSQKHSQLKASQSTLRKHAPRAKRGPTHPFRSASPESEVNEPQRPPTGEELRLVSSDLEDCEEIWIGELSEYMLQTQKRQNQVAEWFEANTVVGKA